MPHSPLAKSSIPDPFNYYVGVDLAQRIQTRNVLLFERRTRETLQMKHLANRMHHRYVLIRVLETPGVVSVDGKSLNLEVGDALLVTPYQFHHYISVACDQLRWMFITFELAQGASMLEKMSHVVCKLDARSFEYWDEYVRLWLSEDTQERYELLPVLDRLLMHLQHGAQSDLQVPAPIQTDQHEWIARIEGLVIRSVRKGWTLEEVARRAQLSERHLRTRFEEAIGVSLRDYRANYQLHTALLLMRDSKLSLSDISELSGFNSQSSFSRFIRRMTDLPPRKLRAKLLKGDLQF